MRFAHIHRVASYLMVATGFAAAYFGGAVHPVLGGGFLLALMLSWMRPAGTEKGLHPTRLWNAATIGAFLYCGMDVFASGEVIRVGFQFLTFLQINKLFNLHGSKDYLQMYVVSFLMLIIGTTLNTELNYGLWFLFYMVFTTWTLILFHLKREMEDNYLLKHSEDASRSRKVEIQRILNSRRIVGPPFLIATGSISLVAFLMSVTLFFLFPRVGFGLFFSNRRTGISMAGFSEEVSLGDFGVIKDNPRVVMRVELGDKHKPVPDVELRWRGATFDSYDGRSWLRKRRGTIFLPKRNGRFLVWPSSEQDLRQTIYLEPLDTRLLFALNRPTAVEIHQGPRELPQGAHYQVKANTQVDLRLEISSTLKDTRMSRWTDPDRFVSNPAIKYTVWSDVQQVNDEQLRALGDTMPEEVLARDRVYLQSPPKLESRVGQLAREVISGRPSLLDKVRAVEAHLKSKYRYTTTLDRDESLAPLEDFLFVQKKGHCEYFATAMVVMLRSQGIPARYVTGFLGGQWNRFGRFYAVRHGDAHSWVEVWFPEYGWQTFDPTPSGSGVRSPQSNSYRTLQLFVDAMRLKWYRYVIEYDLNKQFFAMKQLQEWLPRILQGGAGPGAERSSWLPKRLNRYPTLRRWLPLLIAMLIALAIALPWRLRKLHQAHKNGERSQPMRQATRLYLRLLEALKRRGYPKGAATTASEFVESLRNHASPREVKLAETVTQRYLRARFGQEPLDAKELSLLNGQIQDLPKPTAKHGPGSDARPC